MVVERSIDQCVAEVGPESGRRGEGRAEELRHEVCDSASYCAGNDVVIVRQMIRKDENALRG